MKLKTICGAHTENQKEMPRLLETPTSKAHEEQHIFIFTKFNTDHISQHALYVFGSSCWWSFYYCNGFGWFRLFGVGLKWKDLEKHELMFSQRIGKQKYMKIGKWCIGFLPYNNI
jgi:hypothetical protein